MKALSTATDPDAASLPFDARRGGFVMGEGSGVLVLEELEHARARGAHIYAEVVGYGANCDAYHFTAPAPGGAGAIDCMKQTLADAGIAPEQVDHINAHGTGTHMNDACETAAIHAVFGEHAKELTVVSTKSMTGHLLGGAGGVEAVFTALALRDQFAPPTIHYEQPDPECDLDYAVSYTHLVLDHGSFRELDADLPPQDVLRFPGYPEKLTAAQNKTGLREAAVTATGRIGGVACVAAVLDSRFFMGSMSTAVGEKITRAVE